MWTLSVLPVLLCFAFTGQVPLRGRTDENGQAPGDVSSVLRTDHGARQLNEGKFEQNRERTSVLSRELELHIPGAVDNEEYRLIKKAARAIVRRLSLPSPPALDVLIDQGTHYVMKRTLMLEYAKIKSGIRELVMIALNPEKVHHKAAPATTVPQVVHRVRMGKFLTALEDILQEIILRYNLTTSQAKKMIRICIDVLANELHLSPNKREGLDERVTSNVRARLEWEDEDNKDARLRRLEESVEDDVERYHLFALKLRRLEALKVEEEALKERLSKEEKVRMLKRVYADVTDDLREQKTETMAKTPDFTPQRVTAIVNTINEKAVEMSLTVEELRLLKLVILCAIAQLRKHSSLRPTAGPTQVTAPPTTQTLARSLKAFSPVTAEHQTSHETTELSTANPEKPTVTSQRMDNITRAHLTRKTEAALTTGEHTAHVQMTPSLGSPTEHASTATSRSTEHVSTVTSRSTEQASIVTSRPAGHASTVTSRSTEYALNVTSRPTEHASTVTSRSTAHPATVTSRSTEHASTVTSLSTEHASTGTSLPPGHASTVTSGPTDASTVTARYIEHSSSVTSQPTEHASPVTSWSTEHASTVTSQSTEHASTMTSRSTEHASTVTSRPTEHPSNVTSLPTEHASTVTSLPTEHASAARGEETGKPAKEDEDLTKALAADEHDLKGKTEVKVPSKKRLDELEKELQQEKKREEEMMRHKLTTVITSLPPETATSETPMVTRGSQYTPTRDTHRNPDVLKKEHEATTQATHNTILVSPVTVVTRTEESTQPMKSEKTVVTTSYPTKDATQASDVETTHGLQSSKARTVHTRTSTSGAKTTAPTSSYSKTESKIGEGLTQVHVTEESEHATEPSESYMKSTGYTTQTPEHATETLESYTKPTEHATEEYDHTTQTSEHVTEILEKTANPPTAERHRNVGNEDDDELVRALTNHDAGESMVSRKHYEPDTNNNEQEPTSGRTFERKKGNLLEDELNLAKELQEELRGNTHNVEHSHSKKRLLEEEDSDLANTAQRQFENELRNAEPVKRVKPAAASQNRESADTDRLEEELRELGK